MAYKINNEFNEIYNSNGGKSELHPFTEKLTFKNVPIYDGYNRMIGTKTVKDSYGPTIKASDLRTILEGNGVFSKQSISSNQYTKFSRFGFVDPYHNITSNREILFITKPDLNIFGGDETLMPNIAQSEDFLNPKLKESSVLFREAVDRYYPVLKQLQYNASYSEGPFMYLLSNRVTSSLDLPGISSDQIESAANIYGTTMVYRSHSIKSDQAHDFTLSFTDSEYLEIYMLTKLYDEYYKLLKAGLIQPKKAYVDNKIFDGYFSIYKFVIGQDGETILYWAKDTGVMFKDVPRSDFSEVPQDGFKYSLSFYGHFVKDMDPTILTEFNRVSRTKKSKNNEPQSVYNPTLGIVNNNWATCPIVVKEFNDKSRRAKDGLGNHIYKLKWYN